jgi:hypothetical protein
VWKHVVVERPLPGREDEFVACGVELQSLLTARSWRNYRSWTAEAGDEGEPPLFDVGILNRAASPEGRLHVFECDFGSRDELESQLRAMRNDIEVVRVLVRAQETADRAASRAYVLQTFEP